MTTIFESGLIPGLKQNNINGPVTELYQNYFEPVTYWIRSQGANEEDAADMFQETVLVFIEQVRQDKFRGESSIKTYLSGIAKNLWMNELRSRDRRSNREAGYVNPDAINQEEDVHHRMYNRENKQKLAQVFEQIGDVCKKILTGFYYENLSMKEMLVLFNYENEQVLRNKKSKCMKHLKDLITNNKELTETFKTYLKYDQ
jgi:RNA polymerase sigma factor (sigma-70 family)